MEDLRKPDVVTVAVKQAGGGLTVMRVVVNEYGPDENSPEGRVVINYIEPTTERVDALIAKYVADGHWDGDKAPVGWRFVPNDFVDENTDRTYRNAWKDNPAKQKPDHDMVKAREIHKEKLRTQRQPLLDALDLSYIKADEKGDKTLKDSIVAQKNALRDITVDPRIEAAQTVEDLRLITI
jgi:hypothetical protein